MTSFDQEPPQSPFSGFGSPPGLSDLEVRSDPSPPGRSPVRLDPWPSPIGAAPVVPLQLTPRKPPGLGPVLETPERKSLSPVLETPERPEFFSAAFQKLTPAKFPLGKLSTEHQPGKVEELKEGVWPRGLLPVRAGLQPMEEPHLHRVPLAELLPEPTDARKAWLASQVHEMCQRGAKMSKPGQPCEGTIQEKDDKVTETPQGNLIIEFLLRKADDEEVGMKVSHQGNQPPLKVVAIKSTGAIPSWNKLCAGSWERRAIRPGDQLLSVNGHTEVLEMIREMKDKMLLSFKVKRLREEWRPRCYASI